jgi:hypothetical protein
LAGKKSAKKASKSKITPAKRVIRELTEAELEKASGGSSGKPADPQRPRKSS